MEQAEKAVAAALAAWLTANKTTVESVLAPFNVRVVDGALQVVETADAKLPFGLSSFINPALAASAGADESELAALEGDGVDAIIAALNKVAGTAPASGTPAS